MASRWICLDDSEIDFIKPYLAASDDKKQTNLLKRLERSQQKISVYSAKAKGKDLQFWVCERLSKLLGIPYDQQDDSCLIHSREMGQAGKDIILRGEAKARFPFVIECKSTEYFDLVSSIKQVQANTKEGEDWILVHKRKSLAHPIIVMEWTAFEKHLQIR